MATVTLRIQFEGKIREETKTLKGSTPRTIMTSAREYIDRINIGLPYGRRHELLSVKPRESLTKD